MTKRINFKYILIVAIAVAVALCAYLPAQALAANSENSSNSENSQNNESSETSTNTESTEKRGNINTLSNNTNTETNENSITEYFYNTGNWNEVYVYMWGNSASGEKIEPFAWPGIPAKKVGPNVYSYTFDKTSGLQFYIFNDKANRNQTADLTIEGTSIASTPSYYTTSPGPDARTIYFNNTTTKWDQVWIMKTKVKDAEGKWVETYEKMQRMQNSDSDIWVYTYPDDVKFPPTDIPRTCFIDAETTTTAKHIIKNVNWSDGNHLLIPGYNVAAPMCKINFDTQGYGKAPASEQVIYGGYVVQPEAPTLAGYNFCGWYKQPECTQAWDFSVDIATQQTATLYAKFVPVEQANTPGSDLYKAASTADSAYIVASLAISALIISVASLLKLRKAY